MLSKVCEHEFYLPELHCVIGRGMLISHGRRASRRRGFLRSSLKHTGQMQWAHLRTREDFSCLALGIWFFPEGRAAACKTCIASLEVMQECG